MRIPDASGGYDAADFFAEGRTLKQMIDFVEEK